MKPSACYLYNDCANVREPDGDEIDAHRALADAWERDALAKEYVSKIGYDPFEDDPTITVAEVRQTLAEYGGQPAPITSKPSFDGRRS